MSTLHVLVVTFRTIIALIATIWLASACSSHTASSESHPPSSAMRPVSCRQQYQNWQHGPAQTQVSSLKTALSEVQAAEQTGDVAGMRSAMKEMVPAALTMANHPIPRCADPAGLYAEFVIRIYRVGDNARSAQGFSALLRAAAPLRGLKRIEHQLTAEINRTVTTASAPS